jgi:hypothetical protein
MHSSDVSDVDDT